MKLQLISAAIVAYTIVAMAWICYSGLRAGALNSLPF
jgi:hypothetical protein